MNSLYAHDTEGENFTMILMELHNVSTIKDVRSVTTLALHCTIGSYICALLPFGILTLNQDEGIIVLVVFGL